MTDEEIDKCKDLIEKWKEEANQIKIKEQSTNVAILDAGGHIGQFGELTQKYKKLIEERIGHEIWGQT